MSLSAIEAYAAIASLILPLWKPRLWQKQFIFVERLFRSIALRRGYAVFFVAASYVLVRLAQLAVLGIPQPSIHDEFSHLLAADTFAHGRLTNPVHPLWVHFESFHINSIPTYMSMYPPGQGLFLAAGQFLLGHPWFGVLLAMTFLIAATTWMLQGWMPPGWAMLGGYIVAIRFGLFTYWIEGYWGGSVAAAGGALLLGVYPRLRTGAGIPLAIALASGIFLLAITRPYEGFIICCVLAIPVGRIICKGVRPNPKLYVQRFAAPLCILCLAAGVWLSYYNLRVYGSALTVPYATNRAQYAVAPVFVFQREAAEPSYNHSVMRQFYLGWERESFRRATTLQGYKSLSVARFLQFWAFYLSPLLTVPLLLAMPMIVDSNRLKLLWIALAANAAAIMLCAFTAAHYWAPSFAAILAITLTALRHSRYFALRGRRFGPGFVRLLVLAMVVLAGVRAFAPKMDDGLGEESWHHRHVWFSEREEIMRQLQQQGGKHLIIVRYSSQHNPLAEWVYNSADIDSSPVAWARELDPVQNAKLLAYFQTRRIWLLEPDKQPVAPQLYSTPP